MVETYTVGHGSLPEWAEIMTWEMYEGADGKPGYEVTLGRMHFSLRQGDQIHRTEDGRILVDATNDGYWRGW